MRGARNLLLLLATAGLSALTWDGLLPAYAQSSCTVTISPDSQFVDATFDISGGPGTLRITASAGCSWNVSTDVPWVTFPGITAGGAGVADVPYQVEAMTAQFNRFGAIIVRDASAGPSGAILATLEIEQRDGVLTVMFESPARARRVVQPFDTHGWALAKEASSGTGISDVEVRASIGSETVAFPTTYGLPRAHAAARFGSEFVDSGFTARIDGLAVGPGGTDYGFTAWTTTGSVISPSGFTFVTFVPPAVELNVTALRFAVINAGGSPGAITSAQDLRVTGIGLRPWTATANQPWIQLSRTSGVGAASLSVSIDTTQLSLPPSGLLTGSVRVDVPGVPGTPRDVEIQLQVYQQNTTQPPFGVFETPTNGASGLEGAIPVTGWALDDVQVTLVALYRDAIAPEPPGSLVFVANAGLIEGARPDVRDAFPSFPRRDRAGWGVMVLTKMLPNQGTGTYRLHAFAIDAEGRATLLGSRTFSSNNATATRGFGTIDTPAQGETISGVYTSFGWVVVPQPDTVIPERILVMIDGFYVGWATYGGFRPDIASLFPGLNDTNRASGHFILDTRLLENGLHTLEWWVQTTAGGGFHRIGSRFFVVNNP